ncbi:MAG: NAD-dependent succinate-semialdehyde dehydrogenase [Tatlockia sp.]|jgi:succinate-semialdehyde dehydrogenase/glutarate-semialdehyde dehydrogenase
MTIKTINPATETLIKKYPLLTVAQLSARIESAHLTAEVWKTASFTQRADCMRKLAGLMRESKKELAVLMAHEMGKPVTQGQAEIEKCALVCAHYADHASQYLEPRIIQTEFKKTKVCYRPLGVIFGIMPWNFPFWQVFRFAAPTVMAGNAIIVKHAPITMGCGEKIEALFLAAGFPEHLFQHLVLDNALAATAIAHEKIAAVTLTGSGRAGASVAAVAGAYLKKTVLELGGNDPYIVLEDADLALAAECIVKSRLANCGQVCIAAKRIIAVKSIEEALVTQIKALMANYVMGNPLSEETNLGPLARKDLREVLHQQVQASCIAGAQLLLGGKIPSGTGFYYPPTLLTGVRKGMPAFDEELFGPVIALISAEDEADAIALANQSPYGLGAVVFTRDLAKGERIAQDSLDAGLCFVNAFVVSDPRVPFGGIKQSGYGRELSREGILEFVNTKTVAINA